jgi:hypothetical protein
MMGYDGKLPAQVPTSIGSLKKVLISDLKDNRAGQMRGETYHEKDIRQVILGVIWINISWINSGKTRLPTTLHDTTLQTHLKNLSALFFGLVKRFIHSKQLFT